MVDLCQLRKCFCFLPFQGAHGDGQDEFGKGRWRPLLQAMAMAQVLQLFPFASLFPRLSQLHLYIKWAYALRTHHLCVLYCVMTVCYTCWILLAVFHNSVGLDRSWRRRHSSQGCAEVHEQVAGRHAEAFVSQNLCQFPKEINEY